MPDGERILVPRLGELPFRDFELQGFAGKRRVISFGWRYDFNDRWPRQVDALPAFLPPPRASAAELAGIEPERLRQALVTEYSAGAGAGWHRGEGVSGDAVGVSLLSSCRFRFRRRAVAKWDRAAVALLS